MNLRMFSVGCLLIWLGICCATFWIVMSIGEPIEGTNHVHLDNGEIVSASSIVTAAMMATAIAGAVSGILLIVVVAVIHLLNSNNGTCVGNVPPPPPEPYLSPFNPGHPDNPANPRSRHHKPNLVIAKPVEPPPVWKRGE